mmetsp:Transcript_7893/g.25871  ORF Transcript_7893/g.25871 Transcript_7893/m.25871 type:complete len:288 (+) Transcript_7893:1384-2247(+)
MRHQARMPPPAERLKRSQGAPAAGCSACCEARGAPPSAAWSVMTRDWAEKRPSHAGPPPILASDSDLTGVTINPPALHCTSADCCTRTVAEKAVPRGMVWYRKGASLRAGEAWQPLEANSIRPSSDWRATSVKQPPTPWLSAVPSHTAAQEPLVPASSPSQSHQPPGRWLTVSSACSCVSGPPYSDGTAATCNSSPASTTRLKVSTVAPAPQSQWPCSNPSVQAPREMASTVSHVSAGGSALGSQADSPTSKCFLLTSPWPGQLTVTDPVMIPGERARRKPCGPTSS